MSMFCYQCQETAGGKGCTVRGVCGKEETTAKIQDVTIFLLKGLSYYKTILRANKIKPVVETDYHVITALFMTITNANFDYDAFIKINNETIKLRDKLSDQLKEENILPKNLPEAAVCPIKNNGDYLLYADKAGVLSMENEDNRSLSQMIIYGLKGISAYVEHAYNLGQKDNTITDFIEDTLSYLLSDDMKTDALVAKVLETGNFGVKAMALLDKANTGTYGNPEITKVNIGVGKNPGILISGHDLRDIEMLLKQTEGSGIDIYTHSEMLPAHYYPALKKYPHFVGNYGNAWWKQLDEFESFNGPIVFTSNCIVPPKTSSTYKDRVFTTNAAGYPGFKRITEVANGKDFSEVIDIAKKCSPPKEIEKGEIIGGFAHNQVFMLLDKVVAAVKSGNIRKFIVMAGCDGRMKSREYYTEFAQKLPSDTVILTAGCAKFRYNKLNLGDIDGIPRVLDAGQCNDSYSLVIIALKLKEVFGLDDVNKLPIVYNIAWYEQKAVIVLLALLYLGVKNIHLGPTLPGFLSSNVTALLVEKFGIGGITTPDADIKTMLGL